MDKDRLAASVSTVNLHSYGKSGKTTPLIRRLILQNNAFWSKTVSLSASSSKTCWKKCLWGRVNIRHHDGLIPAVVSTTVPLSFSLGRCVVSKDEPLFSWKALKNGRSTAQLNHLCAALLASPPSAVHARGWRCTSSLGTSWPPAPRLRAPYRVPSKEKTAISSKKHCAVPGKQRAMRLLVWKLSHPPMSSLDTPTKKAH